MAAPRLPTALAIGGAFACTALSTACTSAGPPTRTSVPAGAWLVDAAAGAMNTQGVVFAPYAQPELLGQEQTFAHYGCIEAVNRAVLMELASRYAIRRPQRSVAGRKVPVWARSAVGPRLAVHVEALRCGPVVGDGATTSVVTATAVPREAMRAEVVLAVHDRSTGEPIVVVRSEAHADDALGAARSAAESAVGRLARRSRSARAD